MRHFSFLRVTVCLAAVALVPVWAMADGAAKASAQAAETAGWKHVSTQDYEATQPGLGYSRRFVSAAGWADVFVYDANYRGWLDGVADPKLKPVFESVVGEVSKVAGPGVGYKLEGEAPVIVEGHPFLHAVMALQVRGRPVESHVYLTAADHHLVKFRISLYAPVSASVRPTVDAFIAEQMRFLEKNPAPPTAASVPLQKEISISLSPGSLDSASGKVWLSYAIARARYWTTSGRPLPPVGVIEAGFDEELGARRTALEVYREIKAKESGLHSAYWDALEQVERAGFLPEYVWTFHRHPSWNDERAPKRLAEFDAWRKRNLAGHRPETRSGLMVQGVPASR